MKDKFSLKGKNGLVRTEKGKVSGGFAFTLYCRSENFQLEYLMSVSTKMTHSVS